MTMSAQSIFWGVTIGYFVLLVVISVWSGRRPGPSATT